MRVAVRPLQYARFQSSYTSITKLTNLTEFKNLIKQNDKLVIDFYATWCGPCKMMQPHLTKLIQAYPEVRFVKCDVDESPDIAKECEVTAMPTFVLGKDGQLIGRIIGANPGALEKGIKDL
ncbi:Trx3p [Saccharomyces cerevisiae x Saccharomyces kudriavzevii VIN7]|uniref:Trx3p n=1 Tax=Saccharomyces cerevisiae x Saccharomyces kudriavzevii (strain VIN7) TaxID=1095631 RepID=H0GRZ9_SACCK|nr:Trx3p [Saccharomyces cerevisiae x Saccharomyces kudriavzevii VIN7]